MKLRRKAKLSKPKPLNNTNTTVTQGKEAQEAEKSVERKKVESFPVEKPGEPLKDMPESAVIENNSAVSARGAEGKGAELRTSLLEKEKSSKIAEKKKKPMSSKLANPSFGTVKGSKVSKLSVSGSAGVKNPGLNGVTALSNDENEGKISVEEIPRVSGPSEKDPTTCESETNIKWCSICNLIVLTL